MGPSSTSRFHGIYAATPCPLTDAYEVDESALAKLVSRLASVDGVAGFLLNGHAGENARLPHADQERVVAVAAETVGSRMTLVSGVNCEDSREAAALARRLQAAGAGAIMVFPPFSWALSHDPEMALTHHRFIAEAVTCPLMLYQAPVSAGHLAYTPAVLASLAMLPGVVAVKEGSWETATYEVMRQAVKAANPDVAVMASGDEHLLACFVLGSDGSMVSLAALIPEAIVALDRSVRMGDIATARHLHASIQPLARAIYGAPPGHWANARLKAALHILGAIPNPTMRPPSGNLPDAEIASLRRALTAVGLPTRSAVW
jgi:4-hydroxy-tetrahydrodipicolinate synthase